MSTKEYKCICGKIFDNPQKFNGHKQGCSIHIINKYGSLEAYYTIKNRNAKQVSETLRQNAEKKRQEKLNLWISEQHKCEKCSKIMTEKFGSGRFCSRSCANSKEHSEETKLKIGMSLKSVVEAKYCKTCGKLLCRKNKSGYCSSCYLKQPPTIESRQKQSETMKRKHYPRWNIHRNQPSYAETFFMEVLNSNDIKYEFEYAVPNMNNYYYYLDFYIVKNGALIDLEIDGKQHDDRLEHDNIRDAYLESLGYIVHRIKWNNINTENGKLEMKLKIDEFLKLYNNL